MTSPRQQAFVQHGAFPKHRVECEPTGCFPHDAGVFEEVGCAERWMMNSFLGDKNAIILARKTYLRLFVNILRVFTTTVKPVKATTCPRRPLQPGPGDAKNTVKPVTNG
eukprot:scpid104510/ scgid6793/ 